MCVSRQPRHTRLNALICCICAAPEVVEYAAGIAPQLMGEYVEHVATGMDTYSIRQPLGVRAGPCCSTSMPHRLTLHVSR